MSNLPADLIDDRTDPFFKQIEDLFLRRPEIPPPLPMEADFLHAFSDFCHARNGVELHKALKVLSTNTEGALKRREVLIYKLRFLTEARVKFFEKLWELKKADAGTSKRKKKPSAESPEFLERKLCLVKVHEQLVSRAAHVVSWLLIGNSKEYQDQFLDVAGVLNICALATYSISLSDVQTNQLGVACRQLEILDQLSREPKKRKDQVMLADPAPNTPPIPMALEGVVPVEIHAALWAAANRFWGESFKHGELRASVEKAFSVKSLPRYTTNWLTAMTDEKHLDRSGPRNKYRYTVPSRSQVQPK